MVVFSFNTLNISFYFLLPHVVSEDKSDVILFLKKVLFIYLRVSVLEERGRGEGGRGGGREREGISSRLPAECGADAGLNPTPPRL